MNDIRRTILWVIFGFSMVLLWDKWQVHNGNKATFFPSPAALGAAAPQRLAHRHPKPGLPACLALPRQPWPPSGLLLCPERLLRQPPWRARKSKSPPTSID